MNYLIAPNRKLTDEEYKQHLKPVIEELVTTNNTIVFDWLDAEAFVLVMIDPPLTIGKQLDKLNKTNKHLIKILENLSAIDKIKYVSVIGIAPSQRVTPIAETKIQYFTNFENWKMRTFFN